MSTKNLSLNLMKETIPLNSFTVIDFSPPVKVKYQMFPRGVCEETNLPLYRFVHLDFSEEDLTSKFPWLELKAYKLPTPTKSRITVLHLKNTNKIPKQSKTIIYSHSHNEDLSTIFLHLIELSQVFNCDLISYDYSGYGLSEGKSNEKSLSADMDTTVEFVRSSLATEYSNIILIGHSLGCIPTLKFACSDTIIPVFAIILISPVYSSLQVYGKEMKVGESRFNKINDILCPIFIAHGKADENISYTTIGELIKRIKLPYTWYPKKADSKTILSEFKEKLYEKIRYFINYTEEFYENALSQAKVFKNSNQDDAKSFKSVDLRKSSFTNIDKGTMTGRKSQGASKFCSPVKAPPKKKSVISPVKNIEVQKMWSPQKEKSKNKVNFDLSLTPKKFEKINPEEEKEVVFDDENEKNIIICVNNDNES